MKSKYQVDEGEMAKVIHPQCAEISTGPEEAIDYCRAAQRDERNGYELTAAMEWQKAADLMNSISAADFCWRQWERIMCLPRRLAQPIPEHPPLTDGASSVSTLDCFPNGDLPAVA